MRVSINRIVIFRRSKRLIDSAILVVAAPVWLPVGALVAVMLRLSIGRPIIFKQPRVGLNESPFVLLKFRTMTDQRDARGELLADAARLTRFGRLLRKTSLDELPQFINILRGEMSLVGPRPLYAAYLPYYLEHERVRHSVRPGITGLAQVSGRNSLLWDKRLRLDAEYVERASIARDLSIVVATVRQVIAREGVSVVASDSGQRLDTFRSYPRTDRFALRRFEFADIPQRVEWFSEPSVRLHMKLPDSISIEGTKEWLESARKDPGRHDLVMYDINTSLIAAILGVRDRGVPVAGERREPEMYIIVDPARHGQGLGTLALKLLVDWMKMIPHYRGCSLVVSRANLPAIALYETKGFSVVGSHDDGQRIEMALRWE